MPQLLLELFSEEIPARMQKRAEEDLARLLTQELEAARVIQQVENYTIGVFSSPRRLGAVIDGLPEMSLALQSERKGPKVGAPDAAVQGFLKSAGLKSINDAQIVEDPKGDFYVARRAEEGQPLPKVVAEIVPKIVRAFPWPKSMRSGTSDLQWVRPLQNIFCLFGGAHVKISIDGVPSEATTWGHRFHAPGAITPKDFADYSAKLRAAKVLIDREERKALILEQANAACLKRDLELVPDVGLLEEVAGLVEWPVVLLGDMSADFLDLPHEVIRLSMRTHQKYFAVRDPKTQKLAPHFIVVANIEAKDGGKAIAAGNARVLSARLNDARFFWDGDRKTPLFTEERREKLKKIVFHQKLGSVWDKVERVKALAVELCAVTGADVALVERAAELCKMDLVTETVGEFPELQGQIGRQLYLSELALAPPREGRGQGAGRNATSVASRGAQGSERSASPHPPTPSPTGSLRDPANLGARPLRGREGEGEQVALAIEDHYRPLGPGDRVPTDPVAITLALADKLDTLVGFWAIDEKPTGSSDPYALRRAALGVVRTILANGVRERLSEALNMADTILWDLRVGATLERVYVAGRVFPVPFLLQGKVYRPIFDEIDFDDFQFIRSATSGDGLRSARLAVLAVEKSGDAWTLPNEVPTSDADRFAEHLSYSEEFGSFDAAGLLAFLADRLKVQLRDQGKRHDLVDAVFALGDDDLVRLVARVEALDAFLKTEAGANLLAGYKRAANILAAEEKKGRWSATEAQGAVEASKLTEPAEQALHAALEAAVPRARAGVESEDFAAAMGALAGLRAPVDAFFEKVLVNDPDAGLRRNRLLLLSRLREALSAVADFSKIEG